MSGVGVLDKAVVILAACVDGASLAELVERTKLPRATAHRLAQALEIHRMLVRDTQGRWRPGPRLGELANAAPDVLLTAAEPLLAALRDATGESAQLYLPRHDGRLCALSLESPHSLRTILAVGAVLPVDRGSAGKVLRRSPDVRRRGWAESVEEREKGVASVSAPVWRDGEVVAAVSVSGPVGRTTRSPGRRYAKAVMAAARRIESAMSWGR